MGRARPSPTHSEPLHRSLLAGLASGAVAAVLAALVSLPLRSPDDVFFNTASVAIGSLAVGLAGGLVWHWLGRFKSRRVVFSICAIGAFVIVAVASLGIDAMPDPPLARVPGFVIPLAAIALATLAVLQPRIASSMRVLLPVTSVAMVAALAIGFSLMGRGDSESGRLSLSDLPPITAPSEPTTPEVTPAVLATPAATPDGAPKAASTAAPTPTPKVAAATPTPLAVTPMAVPVVATATPMPPAVGPTPQPLAPTPTPAEAYIVSSNESTATYSVREKLASLSLPSEAVGRTSAITGEIYMDGRPSKVVVDLRTLQSDQSRRDNYIRRTGSLLSERYPWAEYTVTDVGHLIGDLQQGKTISGEVTGRMKIREVERPFTFNIEARMGEGVLQLHGVAEFTWEDFQIPPPNIANFVQVQDKVRIEVLLVAKKR